MDQAFLTFALPADARGDQMKLVVNGEVTEFAEGTTVAEVVEGYGRDPSGRGTAVAVNGNVVPRATWRETSLQDDDEVEVLTAIGGG